jgi:hypothetical protein
MGEVYTGAANVIAWLGEDSDLVFEAIDALPKSDQVLWDPGVAPSVSPEMRSIRHLTALQRLLQRPWWQRVWTVQESILGKNMHFVYGSRKCSAESLFSPRQSFFHHINSRCFDFSRPEGGRLARSLHFTPVTIYDLKAMRKCTALGNVQIREIRCLGFWD